MKQPYLFLILFSYLVSSCASLTLFDEANFSSYKTPRLTEQPFSQQPEIMPIDKTVSLKRNQEKTEDLKPQPIQNNQAIQTDKSIPETLNPEQILSSYQLGAGDFISIKVFGEEDFSMTAHLNEMGTISYPFLGELQLSNLTLHEVEQKITAGLKGDYLVDPKVTVFILEYRKFFVNGEVKNPGGYAFVPGLTVNKAISLAGGFNEAASREDIIIVRYNNKQKTTVPQPADLTSVIKPGDIILIKEHQKFFVKGEVKNPGGYTFVQGLTVEKAIALAGGVTEFGNSHFFKNNVLILRDGENAAKPVSLTTQIKPGDLITVQESLF